MAKLYSAVVALALSLFPVAASAGTIFELSVGSGVRWQPTPTERVPTSAMLAVGYSMPVFKFELGALVSGSDVKHYKSDVDLRPMVVVKPPGIPFYGRAIVGVSNLVNGPQAFCYGGAVGVRMGAVGVGAFLEAGAIAKRAKINDVNKDTWIAEGRLGVYWD
jgi:hypothetical protein